MQDVFLRVIQYARGFRPEGSFRGWLYRIARNAAADSARRIARAAPASGPVPVEEVAAPSTESLEEALVQLPGADREVVVLARVVGLSGNELAAALECSPGAARVRLHRALVRLRANYVERREGNRHAMRRVD